MKAYLTLCRRCAQLKISKAAQSPGSCTAWFPHTLLRAILERQRAAQTKQPGGLEALLEEYHALDSNPLAAQNDSNVDISG